MHKIKSTRAFSAHPCGGIRTRTHAPPRAARGPSARASSAPRRTHLGEALELAELRDHAQRTLLDAREAKAVVERGRGHRESRGADVGASHPPWTRAGGPRAGGGSSPSGGAGARAGGACAVWHALQPQAYARAFICPTAHLISNDVTFSLPREISVDWELFTDLFGTFFANVLISNDVIVLSKIQSVDSDAREIGSFA